MTSCQAEPAGGGRQAERSPKWTYGDPTEVTIFDEEDLIHNEYRLNSFAEEVTYEGE